MSSVKNTTTLEATSTIVAAYASNPNHNMTSEQLIELTSKLFTQLSNFEPVAESESKTPVLSASARKSLAGSMVEVETFNPEAVWPNVSEEEREKFMALIGKHNLQVDQDGVPIPRRRVEDLVEPDFVYDPISGESFKMMKGHIAKAYDLTPNELRAMFNLGDDFVVTAPNYSAFKSKQAAQQGLGRGRKKKQAETSREAAASEPVATAEKKTRKTRQTTKPAAAATTTTDKRTRKVKATPKTPVKASSTRTTKTARNSKKTIAA